MRHSDGRILTTHAGSLPRPPALRDAMIRLSRREPVDAAELATMVDGATAHVVGRQREIGIDIPNDGEQSRESFFTYLQHRMQGFGGGSQRPVMRDLIRYPGFLQLKAPDFARDMVSLLQAPEAVAPITYTDAGPVTRDCERLARLLSIGTPVTEAFMTAPSPGIVACAMKNAYYPSLSDYVAALGEALRVEYETIVQHGFLLQIDAPDLAMERHTLFADESLGAFTAFMDVVIDALNLALRNVPPDRVRLHVCWGNYEAPHDLDVPLEDIVEHLYRARVGGVVLSMANPRHAHEHRVLSRQPLPADWTVVVGAIDPTTNYVEHPEVVAERIERIATAVGDPRRVIAGTDCGFDTAAGLGSVAEDVVWAKLGALVDGARLASTRLF